VGVSPVLSAAGRPGGFSDAVDYHRRVYHAAAAPLAGRLAHADVGIGTLGEITQIGRAALRLSEEGGGSRRHGLVDSRRWPRDTSVGVSISRYGMLADNGTRRRWTQPTSRNGTAGEDDVSETQPVVSRRQPPVAVRISRCTHARGWWWWQSVGRVLDLAIARKPLTDLYETWTLEIRSGRRGGGIVVWLRPATKGG
jgi:hypothetical protein